MGQVKHAFVSAIGDGADATLVRPSNWNADHTLTSIASISSGSYTGNSTVDRAIPHGLGVTPKIVFIIDVPGVFWFRIIEALASIFYIAAATMERYGVTAMNSTNFYVGNATQYYQSANYDARSYRWVAIG